MKAAGRRTRACGIAILVCLLAATSEAGTMARTYQGKPLSAWMDALLNDLDPQYRRAARDAVAHFGAEAVPALIDVLRRNARVESTALATSALVRLGPAGRAIVGRRLADGVGKADPGARAALFAMIQGIADSGPLAKHFIPHLRSLANMPEVSLLALRVLAQTEGASSPQGEDMPSGSGPEEIATIGSGVRVSLVPADCFVLDRFSAVRFQVAEDAGATIRQVRVVFNTALSEDVWLAVAAKPVSKPSENPREYQGILPKPMLEATAISYRIFVRTSLGTVMTEAFVGGLSQSEEGCALVGGRVAGAATPSGLISVVPFKP